MPLLCLPRMLEEKQIDQINTGCLYDSVDGQFLTKIKYRLLSDTSARWAGELIPYDNSHVVHGGQYIIELGDKRRDRGSLRVIRAANGYPIHYVYSFFNGVHPISRQKEQPKVTVRLGMNRRAIRSQLSTIQRRTF